MPEKNVRVSCFQLHWLWILPLVVVTKQKAGQGTSSVRPQFMKTSGQQIYVWKTNALTQTFLPISDLKGGSARSPGLVLSTFYVDLPELDEPIMAGRGQHRSIRRQRSFADSLEEQTFNKNTRHIIRPSVNYYTAMAWISTSNMNFEQHILHKSWLRNDEKNLQAVVLRPHDRCSIYHITNTRYPSVPSLVCGQRFVCDHWRSPLNDMKATQ